MAKKERRNPFDGLFGRGAAEKLEEDLEGVEGNLDEQGLEHKSLELDLDVVDTWLTRQLLNVQNQRIAKATKADVTADDLVDFVMLALEQIAEAGPEADPREVVMEVVRAAFESAEEPIEDIDVTIGEEERAERPEDEDEDEEEKAAKLDLIATVSDDTAAMLKATIETRDMLTALQGVPENIKALASKITAVEAQLAQRPRASESPDTRLDIGRVAKIVKAAAKAESGEENLVTSAGIPGLLPEVPQ